METRNFGLIRNEELVKARFFLRVEVAFDRAQDAVFDEWRQGFGERATMAVAEFFSWSFEVSSRREFALLPKVIREAEAMGARISTLMRWVGIRGEVTLADDPATFWKVLAMAQAYLYE